MSFMRNRLFHVGLHFLPAVICLFTIQPCPAQAADLHVAPSGAPYTSIQAAIDAASDHDTIMIAAGTYSDIHARPAPDGYAGPATISQVVFIDKQLGVFGSYDPTFTTRDPVAHPTIVDAANQGRCMFIAPDLDPVIDGIIMRNGNAAGQGGAIWGTIGGGFFCESSSPILLSCEITDNQADGGGGLYLGYCDYFNLLHCTISNNSSMDFGGGAYILGSGGYIEDCTFSDNYSDNHGGGAYVSYGDPDLVDNRFENNFAIRDGGGLMMYTTGATLTENVFLQNQADQGAGLRSYSSVGNIERNDFQRNVAESSGGGLYLQETTHNLINNFICRNGLIDEFGEGSGMLVDGGSIRMVHNTVARNTGGERYGIFLTDMTGTPATVEIINQITTGQGTGVFVNSGSSVTMDMTLWYDNTTNWGGTGSIDPGSVAYFQNPEYVDPSNGDFHIQSSSPARNKGIDADVPVDFDGHVRPWEGGFDLGADEQRWVPGHGVWINMPQFVSPGKKFFIDGYLENSGTAMSGVHIFFLLDVLGDYWFWPGWTHYDAATSSGVDFETRTVDSGQTRIWVMNPFAWPDTGSTALSNLAIWGAMLDPGTMSLIGEVGHVAWGFGP